MKEQYRATDAQIAVQLPKAEAAALKQLLKENHLTQADFIRGAYWLLKAGKFNELDQIIKNI